MQNLIAELENIGTKEHLRRSNILFYEGEIAKHFFLLLKGRVRVYASPTPNKELTINVFSPISFIAEMPASCGMPYPANAVCLDDCELVVLEFDAFERLCRQKPEFAIKTINSLFQKIKILQIQLNQAVFSLRCRLIKHLLDNEPLLPSLSQRELSKTLGVRAESLSRVIKELKNEGLLATNKGKIVLLDKKALQDEL